MIDLRSDSVSLPTSEMRNSARDAAVGHPSYGGDPTITKLETQAADLLGHEAAMYLPSGTMANQIAARTHAERGQEVILEETSHMYTRESGGLAQLSGLQTRPVDGGPRGVITPAMIHEHVVESTGYHRGTGLVCLENTHNLKGGTAIGADNLQAAIEAAHEYGLSVHLDGARLAQAAVAHDCDLATLAANLDSVYIDIAKLGAPGGAILAGTQDFIEACHHHRKLFGGYVKQGGMLAAPGLVALANLDERAADAQRATELANGLSAEDTLDVLPPETNLVFVDVSGTGKTASSFLESCATNEVLGAAFGRYRVRFVPHAGIVPGDIQRAVDGIIAACSAD